MLKFIPFNLKGIDLSYRDYATIENDIQSYNPTIIGQDESGDYNIYSFKIGNPSKPKIYIMASMHGTEWHGTIIILEFVERLLKRTFPDSQFVSKLLGSYCLVIVPVMNPWGYDRQYRYGSTDTEFNNDFNEWTQSETRAIRDHVISEKPFAFLDFHLMQPDYVTHDIVVSHGHPRTRWVSNYIGRSFQAKTGLPFTQWINSNDPSTSTNSRFWVVGNGSPNTDEVVSATFEITRYDVFSNEEIMEYGLYLLYLFCSYAMNYAEHKTVAYQKEVVTC